MVYLLDTSTFSGLIREDPGVVKWLSSIGDEDRAASCTIVRGEIEYGIARLAGGRRKADLETKAEHLFLAVIPCEGVTSTGLKAWP